MALMFHRRLAIPLWALAFFAAVLAVPAPAALSLVVVLGIVILAFNTMGLISWLHGSPSAARIRSPGQQRTRRTAPVVNAGACVRTLDTPNPTTAEDALDLVRMDDDGGWQMARPPA